MHMLPGPNAYRSIFRNPVGSRVCEAELEDGCIMVNWPSYGVPRRVHRRAHPVSRRAHVVFYQVTSLRAKGLQSPTLRWLKAINHGSVVRDILPLSKPHIGNGLPRMIRWSASNITNFYTVHVDDPLPTVIGNKVVEIEVRGDLVGYSIELQKHLHEGLKRL
ncbi:uncharacterized protein ColSpa_03783 [Colletotrichum spaethianum]|uniref:Uncharacterized protein n=1 Tax=Colletotrichum spaethianum TaxID=700344 RepID=A0AA37LGB0_9PEZI|nr:uncharacterized protein ColSpa_03783 [Colletotrichum spaethianum]GKT43602.1 hypothetical protein ColSpa_03783 [Colletotrichum spaethianum]